MTIKFKRALLKLYIPTTTSFSNSDSSIVQSYFLDYSRSIYLCTNVWDIKVKDSAKLSANNKKISYCKTEESLKKSFVERLNTNTGASSETAGFVKSLNVLIFKIYLTFLHISHVN